MFKKIFIVSLIIIVFGFLYWRNLNSPVDLNGQAQIFLVSQGEAAKEIINNLKKADLIKSPFYFEYRIWRSGLNLKAGQYLISPKLTTREIIKILTQGQALSQEKSIRIIEGWNLKDIDTYLKNNNLIGAEAYLNLVQAPLDDWQFNFSKPDFLNDAPKQANLEGYLFPDTYRIYQETEAQQIIFKLLDNFGRKLSPELRAEIKRQNKTIHEIITMASIIEKEVRSTDDMKIVSGIFWDRIKIGMPLQSDAGLSYILDDKIGGHTFEQTKIDSPYNTYRYRGLPPGPIANPGLNAILAAIYPKQTEYVYFLSDPATGKTIFSKTLEEHNLNKNKYLK